MIVREPRPPSKSRKEKINERKPNSSVYGCTQIHDFSDKLVKHLFSFFQIGVATMSFKCNDKACDEISCHKINALRNFSFK